MLQLPSSHKKPELDIPYMANHGNNNIMTSSRNRRQCVLGLDLGTTKIRALIYDKDGKILGQKSKRIEPIYPRPGWSEIDPDKLWMAVQSVIKESIKDAGLVASDVTCMGISTQRATFVTWNKVTGKELHNFITWKDVRADNLVKEWNSSITMKTLRAASGLMFFLTRLKRFKVASILAFKTEMVIMRLVWALQNISALREAVKNDNAMFGTLDTWLLYKMSKGQTYLTDIGSASATGLFDPFTMQYGAWAFNLFGIPLNIMPPVVDSAGTHFGYTHPDIFSGASIAIRSVMADQSASVFGSGCFYKGDTKMTLGTGSFLDVNTGRKPHASINGLVPVVGWRYQDSLCYLAEGCSHDTSSIVEWAKEMDFFVNPSDTSDIAQSVPGDEFHIYFVPAFFGLQAPINDNSAAAGFIGITPNTGKAEMLRAILESIAFNMKQLQKTMEEESEYMLRNIQVDGGVSRNDFVVQMISDLTGKKIHRATSAEMSAFGAAFLAGLDTGVWSSASELTRIREIEKTFEPEKDPKKLKLLKCHYQRWLEACYRFTSWHKEE